MNVAQSYKFYKPAAHAILDMFLNIHVISVQYDSVSCYNMLYLTLQNQQLNLVTMKVCFFFSEYCSEYWFHRKAESKNELLILRF